MYIDTIRDLTIYEAAAVATRLERGDFGKHTAKERAIRRMLDTQQVFTCPTCGSFISYAALDEDALKGIDEQDFIDCRIECKHCAEWAHVTKAEYNAYKRGW